MERIVVFDHDIHLHGIATIAFAADAQLQAAYGRQVFPGIARDPFGTFIRKAESCQGPWKEIHPIGL